MSNFTQNYDNDNSLSSESIFKQNTPPKLTNISKMYKLFLLSSFILHIILSIVFFLCKFQYLAIYNVLSSTVYIISLNTFKLKRMHIIFVIINIELLLFIVSCSIFMGWQYGFYLYYFLVMQLTLFSSISRKNDTFNLKFALIQFSTISFVLSIVYIYASNTSPIYVINQSNESLFNVIKILNFIFVSVMTFLLNFSFLADVNVANKRLASTNDELNQIATHDPLTSLINRRSMNEQFYLAIEHYQNTQEPFSLILADIDDFKKVNDIYGHDAGDIVLKRVSKIISSIVQKPSSVCRWGGEEILILVYGDLNTSVKIAEQIRGAVAATSFTFNNNYIRSTLTLGVAQYNPSFPIGKTVTLADDNLYKGKKSTKNCVVA